MKIEVESKFNVGDLAAMKSGATVGTKQVFQIVHVETVTCSAGTQIQYLGYIMEDNCRPMPHTANEVELVPLTDELKEQISESRHPYWGVRKKLKDIEKTTKDVADLLK